jgi:hypothetical protein
VSLLVCAFDIFKIVLNCKIIEGDKRISEGQFGTYPRLFHHQDIGDSAHSDTHSLIDLTEFFPHLQKAVLTR